MENKKENKDKRELVQDEIVITSVEAQKANNKIEKLVFNGVNKIGTELRVTWKPKLKKHIFDNGFKTVWEESPETVDDLPDNIKAIAQKVNLNGKANVSVKYQKWEQWSDEIKEYKKPVRYIQTLAHAEEWIIVPDAIGEEGSN